MSATGQDATVQSMAAQQQVGFAASLGRKPGVPAPVLRYVERTGACLDALPAWVRLTQVGEMWQRPGGRTLRFTAEQLLAVDQVAFTWRARFPLLGPVSLRVEDRVVSGHGLLDAHVLGHVRVLHARGPDTDEGEAMRYLAELPWVPQAMLANPQLAWRTLGGSTVEVATRIGPARVAVRLELDAEGDIVRASAERPRLEGAGSVRCPWASVFQDYALVGGVRLPTRAEACWELPEGPFTYWRGTIRSFEAVDAPSAVAA
jgi:hypothetical protein